MPEVAPLIRRGSAQSPELEPFDNRRAFLLVRLRPARLQLPEAAREFPVGHGQSVRASRGSLGPMPGFCLQPFRRFEEAHGGDASQPWTRPAERPMARAVSDRLHWLRGRYEEALQEDRRRWTSGRTNSPTALGEAYLAWENRRSRSASADSAS